MAEPTDVVGVLRSHLEQIQVALINTRSIHEADDLIEQLREGKQNYRPSWIVRQLNNVIGHVEGYLNVDVPEE